MKRSDFVLRMKQILVRRRDALRRTLASELALIGDDHGLEPVGDPCDEAQDSLDDEMSFALAQTESRELRAIENALLRLALGHYGICQDCGCSIPLARLEALPCASLCVKCQRKVEKPRSSATCVGGWHDLVDSSNFSLPGNRDRTLDRAHAIREPGNAFGFD